MEQLHTDLRKGLIDFSMFKSDVLMNKDWVEYHKDLIKPYAKELTITTKDIMMAYLFVFYDFAEEMKAVSCDLIDSFVKTDNLGTSLGNYQRLYMVWKADDKQKVMEELVHMYWNYELIVELNKDHFNTEDEKAFYVEEKNNKQAAILKTLKNMDGLDYFYSYVPVVMDETFTKVVSETLELAFWDSVKADFPNIPKVLAIFKEIRDIVEYLAPRKEKRRIMENFDDMIDTDYIKQLHELGVTDASFWYKKCEYLYALLKDFDSADMSIVHENLWKDWKAKFEGEDDQIVKAYFCIDYLAMFMHTSVKLKEMKHQFETGGMVSL
jgi:hypothetical protein